MKLTRSRWQERFSFFTLTRVQTAFHDGVGCILTCTARKLKKNACYLCIFNAQKRKENELIFVKLRDFVVVVVK